MSNLRTGYVDRYNFVRACDYVRFASHLAVKLYTCFESATQYACARVPRVSCHSRRALQQRPRGLARTSGSTEVLALRADNVMGREIAP